MAAKIEPNRAIRQAERDWPAGIGSIQEFRGAIEP